jgi:hypothetical protein
VLTKNRVSFNPNPLKLPPRPTWCSLSIPTKRRVLQTSRDSTTILESSRVTPSRLGDWITKSNKHNELIEGEGWGALAWIGGSLKESSNILTRTRIKSWILGRERRAQALDLKSIFWFSEWTTTLGVGGGSIYSPHLKRAIRGIFHRTSLVELSGSQSQAGLVRSTGLVCYHHWTSPVGLSGSRYRSLNADHMLDTSGGGIKQIRYPPLEADGFTRQVRWNLDF